jgi:nicotinate-nucleotide--dimethylbenzimidazole phosphoribosyltransferase
LRALEQALREIKSLDEKAMAAARARQDTLTKPPGSLGRLEELSIKLAGISGKPIPKINQTAIVTMAADHGVVAEGVSAYPQAVTPQMVLNFLHGGAGINVLARHVRAKVIVVDMGVASDIAPHPALLSRKIAYGTSNMARGPAMSREQAMTSIEVGLEIIEKEAQKGLDIVGTGDMGIGNTTPSSAITAAITREPVAQVTGRGTGLDDRQLTHKVEVIQRALEVNRPKSDDALDVLAKVGGFEIGGICGVIVGAAAHRIPVVIDGFISGAAALIAVGLSPRVKDYLIASHCSVEIGHKAILKHLGLRPILDLELRLGEGTGAALGIFMVEAAAKILAEMATFAEAGVSERDGEGDKPPVKEG